jgi:hypothetical protein
MSEEVIDRTAREKIAQFELSFGDLREEFDSHRGEFGEHRVEFRKFTDGSFRAHEQADQDRQEIAISEFAKLGTTLKAIDESVKKIEGRQWEETTASRNLRDAAPISKHPRVSPELRQGGIVAGLVTAVIALAEVVKALVHPAPPPPPNTTEIAVEVAKALTAQPKKP